jgi:hypothetical protein
LST